MRVVVGSKAPPKVQAVREVLMEYPLFSGCTVEFTDVHSGVSAHPMSMAELVAGASNRAKAALHECDYSVGIEDGFIPFPGSRTGWLLISVCAIFDGKEFSYGTSCGFESPLVVTKLVEEGFELSDAWVKSGLHTGSKLGYQQGSVGLLTKGRVPRAEQVKQGVRMALIQVENPQLYGVEKSRV